MKKTIWMFAGQGAQFYQMGRELFEKERVFRDFFTRASERLEKWINLSLVDLVYRPRPSRFEPFDRTLYSHPAIFVFECALAETLLQRGCRPDLLLGYSLGEFAAYVIAGCIPFEAALGAVVKMAELLEYCAPAGGMVAVLESDDLMRRHPEGFGECEMAGRNFERGFVVSGLSGPLARTKAFLKEKGIQWLDLPVSHAFHSNSIDVIETPFRAVLRALPIAAPSIPLLSVEQRGALPNPTSDHLWAATRRSLDFCETVRALDSSGPYCFVDLGPSGNMATAVKYNLKPGSSSEFLSISTPFGQELQNFGRVLEKCAAAVV